MRNCQYTIISHKFIG